MHLTSILAHALFLATAAVAVAQPTSPVSSAILPIANADTVGTDDLGRSLPAYEQTGGPKPDRWVGLFYWQWHGGERWWKHYNMTEFLADKSYHTEFEVRPKNGPAHPTWYWAEPLFGYYRATDPWVMRKHLVMFADSGVDFLFLDYTNSSVYDAELAALLKVMRELKDAGVAVPKLTFFFNHQPEWKVHSMYTKWYTNPEWADMWFHWRGKPLLLGMPITDTTKLRPGQDPAVVPAINDFFTFRRTWALGIADKDPTIWRFISDLKAKVALDPQGKPEQIVVNKSQGGPLNTNMAKGGVSAVFGQQRTRQDYTPQWTRPESARGVFIQQAWANAREKNVPMTLVTGWNEWKASVWDHKGVPWFGVPIKPPHGYLVDQFNEEFNRDLEPMKGGYFDAYFMQFLGHMRYYKGMQKPQPVSPPKTIQVDGNPDDWADVTPKFFDAPNDTAERDHEATAPDGKALLAVETDAERKKLPMIRYVNKTARNDIGVTQIARDAERVYFHAKTAKPLSPATDPQWMELLIDADANPKTGWHGYDVRVNRTRTRTNQDGTSQAGVEHYDVAAKTWRPAGDATLAVGQAGIELSLPRGTFAAGGLRFDFKWTDNLPAEATLADFYTDGDVTPNGRLNFRYDESRR